MNQPLSVERIADYAGCIVRISSESPAWFSLEGVFGESCMLKEFNSHRLHVYTVGEVNLWLVEADELASELGFGVIENTSFSPEKVKKTGEPVLV